MTTDSLSELSLPCQFGDLVTTHEKACDSLERVSFPSTRQRGAWKWAIAIKHIFNFF